MSSNRTSSPSNPNSTVSHTIRLLVLGKDGVGKSAFTVRFLTKRFIGEYASGIESIYHKMVTMRDEVCFLEIKDSSFKMSQEVKLINIRWADAIVLMYSIADRQSFKEVQILKRFIDENNQKGYPQPCILIGNKKDLVRARDVSCFEAWRLAAGWGISFRELSVLEEYEEVESTVYDFIKQFCLTKSTEDDDSGLVDFMRRRKMHSQLLERFKSKESKEKIQARERDLREERDRLYVRDSRHRSGIW